MKTLLALVMALGLSGCASGLVEDPEGAYFLISKGGASGPFKWLSGGVSYCKVTQSNLGSTDFLVDVKYDGKECLVEATSSAQYSPQ